MIRNFPFAIKGIFKYTFMLSILFSTHCFAQQYGSWISSSPEKQWVKQHGLKLTKSNVKADVIINLSETQQTIEGFGACFNELGWTSLSLLSDNDREAILKELFQPNTGANFTICRMPVGANDFSRH